MKHFTTILTALAISLTAGDDARANIILTFTPVGGQGSDGATYYWSTGIAGVVDSQGHSTSFDFDLSSLQGYSVVSATFSMYVPSNGVIVHYPPDMQNGAFTSFNVSLLGYAQNNNQVFAAGAFPQSVTITNNYSTNFVPVPTVTTTNVSQDITQYIDQQLQEGNNDPKIAAVPTGIEFSIENGQQGPYPYLDIFYSTPTVTIDAVAVPEPTSLVLLATSALCLTAYCLSTRALRKP